MPYSSRMATKEGTTTMDTIGHGIVATDSRLHPTRTYRGVPACAGSCEPGIITVTDYGQRNGECAVCHKTWLSLIGSSDRVMTHLHAATTIQGLKVAMGTAICGVRITDPRFVAAVPCRRTMNHDESLGHAY